MTVIGNILTDSGHTSIFTGGATDVDSLVFSYTSTILPTNGILTLNASGVFTYKPNIGYT